MQIMRPELRPYFVSLCMRVEASDCIPVEVVSVCHEGWAPKATKCHQNVNRWVSLASGRTAVPGWVITGTDTVGGYWFVAHSVVEEDDRLYDITPADRFPNDSPQDEAPRSFLKHQGTIAAFFEMLPACDQVYFNPRF